MSIKAIIFDMDGTLLYTLDDIVESVNYTMRKYGFKEYSVLEVREAIGNGVRILFERLVPDGCSNPCFENALADFKKNYSANMYNKTKPYDDIIEVLEKLRETGYKLAILSNKFDSAVKELSDKYFKGLIDISVGQKETVAEKPAPDGIIEIAKELGVDVQDCIYIGDSEVDIETANNAGIPCISVAWGYKELDFLYQNGASQIVYIPEDLLELL